jgi:hypothetical protein
LLFLHLPWCFLRLRCLLGSLCQKHFKADGARDSSWIKQ